MPANRLGRPEDIDPARVDIVTDKPKRLRRRKPKPMLDILRPYAAEAEKRARKRPASPGAMLEPNKHGGYDVASPHDDLEAWELQIGDTFGTRSLSVMRTFFQHLRDLCSQSWSEQDGRRKPSEIELNAALAFVSGIRPRNEAEAALAAQMLAVHWMTMRLASQGLRGGYICPKDAAITGKLARTYVMQLDALNRLRGKGRSKQSITVRKDTHVHVHKHAHLHTGADESGTHPHAKPAASTPLIEAGSPLPGDGKDGVVVPIAGRAR